MKPLNINLFKPLFAILAVALACVCMWGCGDDVTFRWSDGRGSAEIAGFINDSFVVAMDCREWYEDTETWNGGYYSESSCGHDRMMVYNYRVQENGPRWSDSLTNKSGGYHWYQMTDSVFWRWDGDNILLWKVGEKAHEMRVSRKNDGCSQLFNIKRIHQWLDGNFVALGAASINGKTIDNALLASDYGNEYCQYAILDTTAKIITYKRLDKDLEWIKQCDDVRAWDDDVYCLALDENNGNSFVLKNGVDSIFAPMEKIYDGHFSGNMIELGVRVCSLINNVITCPDLKWTGNRELEFYRNDGAVIRLPSPN